MSVSVPEGEVPSPALIAARIDLGCAEYHELCCDWMLWNADESLFDEEPACDCGGPEMAKAYTYEKLVNAVADAIGELDAEHQPDPELKGRGGCVMCWPNGSWPCVSRMVADDLREALEGMG